MTEFRLLGPLDALEDGRSIGLGGKRQRTVLALLLLHHGEVVSVDAIFDAVWGAQVPKTAVASLQNSISRLRSELGHDVIERRSPGYAIHVDADAIDVVRFERWVAEAAGMPAPDRVAVLSDALGLWHGTALADFVFEDFAQPFILRLNALRLEAIEGRIEAQLELGRHADLIAEIEALAQAHPSHERLRYLQMLALYRASRQVDALAVFQKTRLALAEELGLEPSEELKALERMILDHDPALDPSRVAALPRIREARRTVTTLRAAPVGEGDAAAEPRRTVAAEWLALASAAVQRHGGRLERLDGLDLLATFGLEATREDDALRAVRAATEIRAGCDRMGTDWRCRIETSEILTGGGALGGTDEPASHAGRNLESSEILLDLATLQRVSGAVEAVPTSDTGYYRLLGLIDGAPAVRRRFDAALVGRDVELDRLEAAVADAWASDTPASIVVLGEPGIGKTRLAGALATRLDDRALALVGRCVPYGAGTTYLPFLEVIRGAVGPGDFRQRLAHRLEHAADGARIAECLAGLEAGGALAQASDVPWAVRRFLEVIAEDRPVLVVLDDAQWAGPTLLDLVEYVVGWCAGPVAILSLARPELLEERPAWVQAAIELAPLSSAASEALLAALPASDRFDDDVVAKMLRTAEGNPLFLEQIAAMAADRPLEPGQVPPTLEALLASRIDTLSPQERDVLDRAAVVGREFWRAAVEALSPGEELATVGSGLMALVRRRLVRPDRAAAPGEDGFRFEHILIRDAAYASIPGERRSDLHERHAVWLEAQPASSPGLVGFHLEAACRAADQTTARSARLAREAASRLGEAGRQATLRLDMSASAQLYRRAVELLPPDDPGRRVFEIELAQALKYEGAMAESIVLLESVEQHARDAGDRVLELRAQIELALPRLVAGGISADAVRALADEAEPIFVAAKDLYAASRAVRIRVNADDILLQYARADEDEQRRVDYCRRAGLPTLEVVHRAISWVMGPTPVEIARKRIAAALEDVDASLIERAYLLMYMGELDAMRGSIHDAREGLAQAELLHLEFSQGFALATAWSRAAAVAEVLAGEPAAAVAILDSAAARLESDANAGWFATLVAHRAAALVEAGRFDEAIEAAESARAAAPRDDLGPQIMWRGALALALAAKGEAVAGEPYAAEAVGLARKTEAPCVLADALLALAEAGSSTRAPEATTALVAEALQVLEAKGNVARARQVRARARNPRDRRVRSTRP